MSALSGTIISEMLALANPSEAKHLMRFFKTGKGEYGEGDTFLGIRVPTSRAIVKEYKKEVTPEDIPTLLASKYHEIRLVGFLLLIELYNQAKQRKNQTEMRGIINYYLSVIGRGNNWDLVDVVAPKLLGSWISMHPQEAYLLYELVSMTGQLWHQRVAIVATLTLIRDGNYKHTLCLAEQLLTHPHDLIHKAVGWMLREVGKHGGKEELLCFLNRHAPAMPRTMLRYSIEHFSADERRLYMQGQPQRGTKD